MEVERPLEQFSLRWDNYNDNIRSGFHDLLRGEEFVDVTIAAEGKTVLAHKMVLSIFSPYFKSIFKSNPCQHPIVFLKDVTYKELSVILQFMYVGEVSIKQEELKGFLKTAEALQINGLYSGFSDIDKAYTENKTGSGKNELVFCNDTSRSCKVQVSQGDSYERGEFKKLNIASSVNVSSPFCADVQVNLGEKAVGNIDSEIFTMGQSQVECYDSEKGDPLQDETNSNGDYEYCNTKLDESYESVGILTNGNKSEMRQNIFDEILRINKLDKQLAFDQGIRFVISQRRKLCLVFNSYLYIRDHVGMSVPGQPKTYYWRCKNMACKARCIQTDFKFKLKADTYHRHEPNTDKNYLPVTLKQAYKMLKLIS